MNMIFLILFRNTNQLERLTCVSTDQSLIFPKDKTQKKSEIGIVDSMIN